MLTQDSSSEVLQFDPYRRSLTSIRRLKSRLPEALVADLAQEVIRRLADHDRQFADVPHTPTEDELEELCHALISPDDEAAARIIAGMRAENVPVKAIYMKYLAAAARMLGDWWLEDRASFVEVTIGTGRLFSIMRGMRHLFATPQVSQKMSVVFASVPGEQHTLGVRMAADLFRDDGWDITLRTGLDHDALVAELETYPSSIIGLSIGGQHSLQPLSRLVTALRICCPQAPIMVCGQDVDSVRPVLDLMGLDGIAGELSEAKEQLATLWDREIAQADQPIGLDQATCNRSQSAKT